jgi:superfamily II DNA/RNA helicase
MNKDDHNYESTSCNNTSYIFVFQAAFLLPIITGMVRDGCSASQFDTISGTKTQTPECVVIAPTRELVVQIYKEARKFAYNSVIRPVVVYGGTSVGHQIRQVEAGTNIIVATPGRLQDFVTRSVVRISIYHAFQFLKCTSWLKNLLHAQRVNSGELSGTSW